MRSLVLLILAASQIGAAIFEPGKHYDFIQKNGQNVLGAEIVGETATEYTIRLAYVPTPIKILKSNLLSEPKLSKVQPQIATHVHLRRDLVMNAGLGYALLNSGPVASIFRSGYRITAGIDWLPLRDYFWRIQAITAAAAFSRFTESGRFIQLTDLHIGPRFYLGQWTGAGLEFYASPLVGLAYVQLKGYTFESSYFNISTLASLQVEKHLGLISIITQLTINSLFDKSQIFTSTALGLAVSYPLTSGARPKSD